MKKKGWNPIYSVWIPSFSSCNDQVFKYFASVKRGIRVIRGNFLCLAIYMIRSLKWLEPSNLLLKSRSNIKQFSMFRKWRQIAVTSRYPVLSGLISHSLVMSLLVLLLLVTFYEQATKLSLNFSHFSQPMLWFEPSRFESYKPLYVHLY